MNKQDKLRMYEFRKKSPGSAAFLSLLIPGLGQLYVGNTARGIVQFFLAMLLWFILMGWVVNIISCVDAHGQAGIKNEMSRMELGI